MPFRSIQELPSRFIPSLSSSVASSLIALLPPALIPPIHIGSLYYFWHELTRRVDKRYCSCSCWDTVFKGTYETGIAKYKHLYFNASVNTFKMWALTVLCVIAFYESVRKLIALGLQSNLRYTMLLLFLSAIFSHYYSWWVYVNYWNDDFYSQWYHQLFFTLTELVSTLVVLHLADRRTPLSPRKALSIASIAIVHAVAGSVDQFFLNVVKGEGQFHQIVRDVSLMIPDILHILVPLIELRREKHCLSSCKYVAVSDLKRDLIVIMSLAVVGLIVCSVV